MTIEGVVRRGLREEHADVIRESVRAVTQELMEAEVSELMAPSAGAQRGSRDTSQWVSSAAVGHQGGRDRVADPQAAPRQLLPVGFAAQALGAGAGQRC